MHPAITLRRMTRADLPFADDLRARAGWNQLPADWERMLAYEPDGCFVAEWAGTPAGTATTTRYRGELAWIGMVLVHPAFRRRGLGRALLEACVEYLGSVPCVKLDATPLGKPLYEQLGFVEELRLHRWEGKAPAPAGAKDSAVRAWEARWTPAVLELDRRAFGIERGAMLDALARDSSRALVCLGPDGHVKGYGMLRPGSRAHYLGPVVAESADVGCQLVEQLLSSVAGQVLYWDILEENTVAGTLAKRLGFASQRPLVRMLRGKNHCPGDPELQFGIGDPSTG